MKRWIALTCALAALAAVPAGQAATTSSGSLVVTSHFDPSDGVPTEGFYEYLRIVHDGKQVMRVQLTKDRTVIPLGPGRYRLVRYSRNCDGNCGFLDPPGNRCRADAVVARGKRTAVAINSFAARCRVTASAPR